ncbi:MAG TPA: ABC transporter ATP-binding protein, partial [Actinopolymorphaceae bacterium]
MLDPHGARTGKPIGEVLSVATSDATRAATFLRVGPAFVAASCALVVAAVVLLSIDVVLGATVLARLRERVVDRALRLPSARLERVGSGDLLTRVGDDVAV